MTVRGTRAFTVNGTEWRIRRQPSVAVATGYRPPPPPSGLLFTLETGERRFLPMSYPFELPSVKQFEGLTEQQLRDLLSKARPEA